MCINSHDVPPPEEGSDSPAGGPKTPGLASTLRKAPVEKEGAPSPLQSSSATKNSAQEGRLLNLAHMQGTVKNYYECMIEQLHVNIVCWGVQYFVNVTLLVLFSVYKPKDLVEPRKVKCLCRVSLYQLMLFRLKMFCHFFMLFACLCVNVFLSVFHHLHNAASIHAPHMPCSLLSGPH